MRIFPLRIEDQVQAKTLLREYGVSNEGVRILAPKSVRAAFAIEGISSWEANIIKQHLLSLGSDSAISRDALVKDVKTKTLVFGSVSQLKKLCRKLRNQPFHLKEIAQVLDADLDNLSGKRYLRIRGRRIALQNPLICGILNITPDSFSGDGLLSGEAFSSKRVCTLALQKVELMVTQGAKMVDIGGESSRPFSKPVPEKTERLRVIPVLKALRKEFKRILISVDTYKYAVAKESLESGADIINDITALRKSPRIAGLIQKHGAGCILMHMKGTPQRMQVAPRYGNVVAEIADFFQERLSFCERQGLLREQLLIDPGIGFGKRLEDNLCIVNGLHTFRKFGTPVFVGISRKSFIGKITRKHVHERLMGTLGATVVAALKGADCLRVHDVEETSQALRVACAITQCS